MSTIFLLFINDSSNSSGFWGDLAHPLYVFIQLFFVLSQPLLNFAHIFSQEDLCIFCSTNLQLYVLRLCTQVCVHVTMRAYIDLHSVQTVAHFVCLGSILSVQCAHLGNSERYTFCAYCSYFCEFANIVLFCTFCDQFTPVCASCISPMAVDTVYSQCQKRIKSGSIFGAGTAHNK